MVAFWSKSSTKRTNDNTTWLTGYGKTYTTRVSHFAVYHSNPLCRFCYWSNHFHINQCLQRWYHDMTDRLIFISRLSSHFAGSAHWSAVVDSGIICSYLSVDYASDIFCPVDTSFGCPYIFWVLVHSHSASCTYFCNTSSVITLDIFQTSMTSAR